MLPTHFGRPMGVHAHRRVRTRRARNGRRTERIRRRRSVGRDGVVEREHRGRRRCRSRRRRCASSMLGDDDDRLRRVALWAAPSRSSSGRAGRRLGRPSASARIDRRRGIVVRRRQQGPSNLAQAGRDTIGDLDQSAAASRTRPRWATRNCSRWSTSDSRKSRRAFSESTSLWPRLSSLGSPMRGPRRGLVEHGAQPSLGSSRDGGGRLVVRGGHDRAASDLASATSRIGGALREHAACG